MAHDRPQLHLQLGGSRRRALLQLDPFDPAATYNPVRQLTRVSCRKVGTTDATGAFTFEVPADLGSTIASLDPGCHITDPTSQQVYNNVKLPPCIAANSTSALRPRPWWRPAARRRWTLSP